MQENFYIFTLWQRNSISFLCKKTRDIKVPLPFLSYLLGKEYQMQNQSISFFILKKVVKVKLLVFLFFFSPGNPSLKNSWNQICTFFLLFSHIKNSWKLLELVCFTYVLNAALVNGLVWSTSPQSYHFFFFEKKGIRLFPLERQITKNSWNLCE